MTSESITKLSIDQLRVGMTESVSKIITIDDVRKFSELSLYFPLKGLFLLIFLSSSSFF